MSRFVLLVIVAGVYGVTILGAVLAVFFCDEPRRGFLKDLLFVLLPTETLPLGAVIGYYFTGNAG
jgi:hypothetical protein